MRISFQLIRKPVGRPLNELTYFLFAVFEGIEVQNAKPDQFHVSIGPDPTELATKLFVGCHHLTPYLLAFYEMMPRSFSYAGQVCFYAHGEKSVNLPSDSVIILLK